jgi:hypothetical protein
MMSFIDLSWKPHAEPKSTSQLTNIAVEPSTRDISALGKPTPVGLPGHTQGRLKGDGCFIVVSTGTPVTRISADSTSGLPDVTMNRSALAVAACALMLSCNEPVEPEPTPAPAFVVSGTVRDDAGLPVSGARAEILDGAYRGWVRLTNDSGAFSLANVNGAMSFGVSKVGFGPESYNLFVNSDLTMNVILPRLENSDSIVFGKTIRSYVVNGTPPCDPNWDANAPCRRFRINPPVSGKLTVTISWVQGGSDLDVVIVSPVGRYLAYSDTPVPNAVAVVTTVNGGDAYELRVHSYYGTLFFSVKAELSPFSNNKVP